MPVTQPASLGSLALVKRLELGRGLGFAVDRTAVVNMKLSIATTTRSVKWEVCLNYECGRIPAALSLGIGRG
jgi:hypothetical protein